MPIVFCNIKTCNCDNCRYWRWKESLPTEETKCISDFERIQEYEKYFSADVATFLEREARGEILATARDSVTT